MRQDQISWKDAERVVRLHRRMTGQSGQVSLSSLARSLGRSEEEVATMLQQVRWGGLPGRRRFADPGGWLSAGLAAVAVGLLLAFGTFGAVRHAFGSAARSAVEGAPAHHAAASTDLARIDVPDPGLNIRIEVPNIPPPPRSRA